MTAGIIIINLEEVAQIYIIHLVYHLDLVYQLLASWSLGWLNGAFSTFVRTYICQPIPGSVWSSYVALTPTD